jgi:hypothetical protein
MVGSITKQFDFIINSATHAVSKKCDLKLPRSTSFNYVVAESINDFDCAAFARELDLFYYAAQVLSNRAN